MIEIVDVAPSREEDLRKITKPRPGHASLSEESNTVLTSVIPLERSSAVNDMRVAVGAVAKRILEIGVLAIVNFGESRLQLRES